MAQIRETIVLLADILKANGVSKIKAETFRLAKFNSDDAVESMWKVLFELLYYCDYGKIDDVCLRAYGELTQEECAVYVKTELQARGFNSRDFGSLATDMTSGSRELLLALGWLVCKESILEKFMRNCTSPLEEDTMSLHHEDVEASWKQQNIGNLSEDPEDRVCQLLLLNNKLQLSLRGLLALQHEKNRLAHKIHESTKGVSLSPERDHLSVLEVYMLKHPEILKKNLQLLEKDNKRLQNLLLWREHEDIFWQWMETVLDAKLEDVKKEEDINQESLPEAVNVLQADGLKRLQNSHDRLRDAIVKYENIVDRLETLWEIKSSEVTEAELDNVLAAIDLEISIQRANIALNNTDVYLERAGYPKLAYVQKGGRQARHHTSSASDTETSRDMEEEIGIMEDLVDRLQSGIIEQQNTYKEELHGLADKFTDAICIPPMSRKSYKV